MYYLSILYIFQLENEYSLYDYRINVNEVIQLFDMVGYNCKKIEENSQKNKSVSISSPSTSSTSHEEVFDYVNDLEI